MSDGVTNLPVQRALRGIQKGGDAGQLGDTRKNTVVECTNLRIK